MVLQSPKEIHKRVRLLNKTQTFQRLYYYIYKFYLANVSKLSDFIFIFGWCNAFFQFQNQIVLF